MKRIGLFIVIAALALGLIGCSKEPPFIAENVVSNAAIAAIHPFYAYAAEIELKTTSPDGDVIEHEIKEWVSEDGKRRTETQLKGSEDKTITVFTGRQYISYVPETHEVLLYTSDEIYSQIHAISSRTQTIQQLATIQTTHELTAVGEEEVAGRNAFYVTAEQEDSEDGDEQQFWIDQENWLVLKMHSTDEDASIELQYTSLEVEPEFSDNVFRLEFPEGAPIKDLDRASSIEDDDGESEADQSEETEEAEDSAQ